MNSTVKPIRSTIIWGLISGLGYIPVWVAFSRFLFWPMSFQVSLLIWLAGYGILLSRWAPRPLRAIALPLLLLFLAVFFIRSASAFLFTSIVVLGWVRSGICFKEKPFLKRIGAEIGLGLAAGLLVSAAMPAGAITWALGIWLFFLIQSLYFVLFDDQGDAQIKIEMDPFEKAKMAAENILSSGIF